jgi:hypothetical protein
MITALQSSLTSSFVLGLKAHHGKKQVGVDRQLKADLPHAIPKTPYLFNASFRKGTLP